MRYVAFLADITIKNLLA